VPYWALAVSLVPAWIVMLGLFGAYDRRFLAAGSEEFRRVANAGVWLTGATVFIVFVLHVSLSREFVAICFPVLLVATVVERYAIRRQLHRQVASGRAIYRTVLVGSEHEVGELSEHMQRSPWAGFQVVGTHVVGDADDPEHFNPEALVASVRLLSGDTIAVAGTRPFKNGALRALSWRLEGTGIKLVVAPAITDVAGPRIVVRPVQGLPLLLVEDPEFTGSQRLLKEAMDRVGAAALLICVSPLLLIVSLLIKLTSPGPVFYRQERVGLAGKSFWMWKFRSMRVGADRELIGYAHMNHYDDVMFKIRDDPRVTSVGRWIRAHSMDELPQLWNVLRGDMSLVGPRPPLPSEVLRYGRHAHRRLLVKPGMTGLWQVSGRANLPWDETVRLDLFYVENWSVVMDFMVLWKTFGAVLRGRGAY
jgi:exopolysaccharide biosynthesis polyprenyl glycosylphosphotransferase